jgi:hypothetical protein
VLGDEMCESCEKYCSRKCRKELIEKASKEDDKWEDRKLTDDKIDINDRLTSSLDKAFEYGDKNLANIFTLDGGDLYTSCQFIRKLKIPSSNIYVPAPFNGSHEETMNNEYNPDLKDIELHQEFAFDLLSRVDKKFLVIFLDYCGTFDGSLQTIPRIDIDLIFKRKLLCSSEFQYAKLALTFCLRDDRINTSHKDQIKRILDTVEKLAEKNDYRINNIDFKYEYGSSMFFCSFEVEECDEEEEYNRLMQNSLKEMKMIKKYDRPKNSIEHEEKADKSSNENSPVESKTIIEEKHNLPTLNRKRQRSKDDDEDEINRGKKEIKVNQKDPESKEEKLSNSFDKKDSNHWLEFVNKWGTHIFDSGVEMKERMLKEFKKVAWMEEFKKVATWMEKYDEIEFD